MSIKTENDFSLATQSCIAPIYFFDQRNPPVNGKKMTINGTTTLVRSKDKVYGITNYHVYEKYKNKKETNQNTVFQIGYQCEIKLEDKIIHTDENNDLILFNLDDDDLNKISTGQCQKTGFDLLDTNIEEYLQNQDESNPRTWFLHFAGYPGAYKETTLISNMAYREDFKIDLYHAPGEYVDETKKIMLNFSLVKKIKKK